MRTRITTILAISLFALLALAVCAQAKGVEDRESTGGGVIIGEGETVNDAAAVSGDLDIRGHVLGDASAVNGDVIIRRTGRVDGDVSVVGGKLIREPGSQVGGDIVSVGGLPGRMLRDALRFHHGRSWDIDLFPSILHTPFTDDTWVISLVVMLAATLLFAVVAVVIAAIIPDRIEMVASTAFDRPGWSALHGFVAACLTIPIGLFLLVTLVGIPLIPVWILIILAAVVVGKTAVRVAMGRKLGNALSRPIASIVVAVLVGSLVWAVVDLVPIAGPLLLLVLSLLGFGAVWITGFGTHPDWFANKVRRVPNAGPTPAPPPAPPTPQEGTAD